MTMKPLSVLLAAFAAVLLLVLTPSTASATTASAGRDNYWRSCDAQVHTSDTTSPGNIEVFGGWGCASADKFTGTLVCIVFTNGIERARVTKDITLASTLSCAVKYPDYAAVENVQGTLIVQGLGGTNFRLTTGQFNT